MIKKILLLILVVCLQTAFVAAQTSAGRLNGTVSGPDGVLPNATVTVKDMKTNRELTASTKEDGSFLFPQLEFGTYTVTVKVAGFKTFIANEVKIDVGREYALNPQLEIGDIQESVTITAGADIITATTAQISNTVSSQQILSLPLLTRNPLNLTYLQPGVQSNAIQETAINGMRTSFTNITRDGINIQDNYIRQNATDFAPGRPSVDDTAEFTITTSNQEADQGYGGAQIRLVTPRGTSEFHGALFAYNRNSAFAANNFFSNRSGQALPYRNRNQFGGKIGGPMPVFNFGEGGPMFLKDKGFFFFAYERVIDPLSSLVNRTILTPGARTGEFRYNRTSFGTGVPGDAINTTIGSANVVCPEKRSADQASVCTVSNILGLANGLGFANTPTSINQQIQSRLISQLPANGNFTGLGDQLNTTGFQFNRQTNTEQTTYTSRIDLDINDKNTINGVYSFVKEPTLRNDMDPSGFTTIPRGDLTSVGKTMALAYRRIFSSNVVNEVRGGFFMQKVLFNGYENPGFALTLPTGFISNPENNELNQGREVKNINIQDNVDWIAGKHNFKFGGQMQFFNPNPFTQFGVLPQATIGTSVATPFFIASDLPGGINPTQLGTANNLLAVLGGYVSGYQQTFNLVNPEQGFATIPNYRPTRYENHSLYFSDRFQVTSNLTLTAGLRYELFPALRQTNGVALEPVMDPDNPINSLLDPNGTNDVVGGNAGKPTAFYKTDYNNFAPQIGFAWAPKSSNSLGKWLFGNSSVIRGGYSHIYGNDQLVTSVLQAPSNIVGLAGRTLFGTTPAGSTLLNLRLGDSLPSITAPALDPPPPYSFIRNNTPGIGGQTISGITFGVDPKLKTPMYQQYSFGIQREFWGNTAFEVRYVGTYSNNLPRAININQIDIVSNGFLADFIRARTNLLATGNAFCNPQTVANCQGLQVFQSGTSVPIGNTAIVGGATPGAGRLTVGTGGLNPATFNNALTNGLPADLASSFYSLGFNNHPTLNNPTAAPYVNLLPNPAGGLMVFLTNDAWSIYNSLQIEVRRRFSQGFYFQANYTFSKTLTNAIGGDQFYFEPYLDNANPQLNIQRADFDTTHVFNFNGVYELPFGKNRHFLNQNGFINAIIGGWNLSGSLSLTSGAPISIVDPRGTFNTNALSGRQTPMTNLTNEQVRALGGVYEANDRIYFINPSIICPNNQATAGFGQTPCENQVFFNNNPGEVGNLRRTSITGPKYFNVNVALLKNINFNERIRIQLRAEAFNLLNNVNFISYTQAANINSATFGQLTVAADPRRLQFGARFEF